MTMAMPTPRPIRRPAAAGRRAPSSGPPGGAAARRPLVGLARPAGSRSMRSGSRSSVGRRTRRRCVLVVVVAGAAAGRVAADAAVRILAADAAPRGGEAPPGSRRTGRASSGESSRVRLRRRRAHGRCRPSTARRNAARTVSASSLRRIVAARAGSNRKAARTASGARHGRVGSSGGAISAEAHLEPAGVLEDQPGQRARDGRPEAGERRVGRRAGGRRDVAEADDALVVGDPQDRQPPAVGRVGRPGHAGPERAVADRGPRARAGTTGRAAGVDRARPQDSGRARSGRARPRRRRARRPRRVGAASGRRGGGLAASPALAGAASGRIGSRPPSATVAARMSSTAGPRRPPRRGARRPRPGGWRPRPRARAGASRGGPRGRAGRAPWRRRVGWTSSSGTRR